MTERVMTSHPVATRIRILLRHILTGYVLGKCFFFCTAHELRAEIFSAFFAENYFGFAVLFNYLMPRVHQALYQ
ncbi:hypothetical protein C2134_15860 [Chromobacterium sinusclupearum]|uniref:Uncharacterized protein n=1 Tax=Chromobacterium sinusclupearum TaxID=2077146 RepID=A0A2K4MJN7_9NEIS|nr:hypothetical protein C2134_15860 [Chromobacterium sinusclupearum]